jgi:hypothetical protein
MNHTPFQYAIGVVALGLAGTANLKAPQKQTVIQPVQQATPSGKINPYAWGELEQAEVNALQRKLEAVAKLPVVIFCSDDNCKDMALDFENAFESAHWATDIERPMIDNARGIWTSSNEIAAAITSATSGRLKVSILGPEWADKSKIALAIGKKPR